MADLEYWSNAKTTKYDNRNSNKVEENNMEVEMEEITKAPRLEVDEWKEQAKEEMKIKYAKVTSLEEALANNRELTNIIKVEKESLEMYNNEKNDKIKELDNMAIKFKNTFVNMTAQMKEPKSAKGEEDSTEKV